MKHPAEFAAADQPVVRLPQQGIPGVAIAIVALAAAILLFVVLNGQRQQRTNSRVASAGPAFSAPPPLTLLPEPELQAVVTTTSPPAVVTSVLPPARAPRAQSVVPPPQPATVPIIVAAPPLPAPEVSAVLAEPSARQLAAPALVVDTIGDNGGASTPTGSAGSARSGTQDDTPVRAARISNQSSTVPIGTLIPIVLETPIDTTRPGLVRAVVSSDIRGFDGRRILVPRGSRLIGEYQADVRPGQNRVLVGWTRLVRPDGVTMRLGSPAADELGGAGVPGRLHSYFLQRFASAVLQSALTVGVNIASRPRAGSVVVGLPTSPIQTLGQNLLPGSDLRPKITVKQGAILNVFVARDLDFSGAGIRQ